MSSSRNSTAAAVILDTTDEEKTPGSPAFRQRLNDAPVREASVDVPIAPLVHSNTSQESQLISSQGQAGKRRRFKALLLDAPAPLLKRRRLTGKQPPPSPNPFETKTMARELQPVPQPSPVTPIAKKAPRVKKTPRTHQLCFTATSVELSRSQIRFLTSTLGANVVDEWSPGVSHLIADTFRRTTKLMCAICAGVPIVTPAYIDACRKANCLVDCKPFQLQDKLCEAAFAKKHGLPGFSLEAASEQRRQCGPLLEGMSVHCFTSVTERRDLQAVVEAAGGRWVRKPPVAWELPSVLLLGQAGIKPEERELDKWQAGLVYDTELIREAACTQVLRRNVYRLQVPVDQTSAS